MSNLQHTLVSLLARDARYSIQAYAFLFEALEHARTLKLRKARSRGVTSAKGGRPRRSKSRHVTGQQLCEGARVLALEQYGQLAPMVLGEWGIRSTSDLGELVFNLISAGDMVKTATDKRTDFDDVYDFATAFQGISLEEADDPF